MQLTVYIEYDDETQLFVGMIPHIAGAHTQGATLDELEKNLVEALELLAEENPEAFADLPRFVGIHQVEINL